MVVLVLKAVNCEFCLMCHCSLTLHLAWVNLHGGLLGQGLSSTLGYHPAALQLGGRAVQSNNLSDSLKPGSTYLAGHVVMLG